MPSLAPKSHRMLAELRRKADEFERQLRLDYPRGLTIKWSHGAVVRQGTVCGYDGDNLIVDTQLGSVRVGILRVLQQ